MNHSSITARGFHRVVERREEKREEGDRGDQEEKREETKVERAVKPVIKSLSPLHSQEYPEKFTVI